jgi:hypothetical protein
MLASLHRKVDRLLAGQLKEGRQLVKITEVLDAAGTSLDRLEGDDAALLAKLTEIEQSGGELTPEQAAQAADILARIDAVDAADVAAFNAANGQPAGPAATDGGDAAPSDSAPGSAGDGGTPPADAPSTGDTPA